MKKSKEQFVDSLKKIRILCAIMVVFMTFSFVSCGSDEPEENNGDEPATSLVTVNELAGKWTLVKDNVLYSQVNSSKKDEIIDYSGMTAPLYRYYNVTAVDDDEISIVEVSVSGRVVGKAMQLELDGNDLKTQDGNVAGRITHYDAQHSWDNLRIEWNKDYSPISFDAPVISTYML